jgi:hypothetical protein
MEPCHEHVMTIHAVYESYELYVTHYMCIIFVIKENETLKCLKRGVH